MESDREPEANDGGEGDKKDYYLNKLSETYNNDLNSMKFSLPLIFIIKEKSIYDEFFVHENESDKFINLKNFVQKLEELLNCQKSSRDYKQKMEELFQNNEPKNNLKNIKELIKNDENLKDYTKKNRRNIKI